MYAWAASIFWNIQDCLSFNLFWHFFFVHRRGFEMHERSIICVERIEAPMAPDKDDDEKRQMVSNDDGCVYSFYTSFVASILANDFFGTCNVSNPHQYEI